MMKHINKLIVLSLLALGSTPALARHHQGYGDGMWQQNASPLSTEQYATVQQIHNDYDTQTSALRQQLMSKRYEYNALLTASSPDSAKISALAKEMTTLNQSLDEQRVQRDIALAQAGVTRNNIMGYDGCGGHRGMGSW